MNNPRSLPCGRPCQTPASPPTTVQLTTMQNRLKDYLSKEGLKYTEQRWSIAKTILMAAGHLDAQQIVDKVHKFNSEIGPATVYRSIKVLCDAGLLEKSHQSVDGRIIYEIPHEEHHDHIICLDCGEIFEFHDDNIEKLQEEAAESLSFQLAGHRHVIHGKCSFLQKKKANRT
jgi:Fur family ferric uptake transcriptional regulator